MPPPREWQGVQECWVFEPAVQLPMLRRYAIVKVLAARRKESP